MLDTQESDIRQIDRGTQVTFEKRGMTVIGEVGDYLGEGIYSVKDTDEDETHEVHIDDLTVEEED